MKTPPDLLSVLARLKHSSATTPHEVRGLLQQLAAALEQLPPGASLAALKKTGAWPDLPLPANTPKSPCYVKTPIAIEVVNVSRGVLDRDLANHPVTQDRDPYGARITIPSPITLG